MKTLNILETQQVSAAAFDLAGQHITVDSTGIPSQYYSIMDNYVGNAILGAVYIYNNVPEHYIEAYFDNLSNNAELGLALDTLFN